MEDYLFTFVLHQYWYNSDFIYRASTTRKCL